MQSGPDGDVHIGEKCSVVGFVQESTCCLTRFPPWVEKEKEKKRRGRRAQSFQHPVCSGEEICPTRDLGLRISISFLPNCVLSLSFPHN